jgi:hypothetical protein
MRTTLTLDDDVAARLSRVQTAQKKPFKEVVNHALRQGLKQMTEAAPSQTRFETRTADLGRCLIGSVDDVSEALAFAEGESYK